MRRWLTSVAMLVCVIALAACSHGKRSTAAPGTTTAPIATSIPSVGSSAPRPEAITACPKTAPVHVSRHQRVETELTVVPGRPIALLACRYHGFNQPEPIGTFAGSADLPAGQVAGELNATPRPRSKALPYCPADFGEKYVLHFLYGSGSPLIVEMGHGGCRYVTNGDLSLPFAPLSVTHRLESALGEDHL